MYENLRAYDLVVRVGGDEFLCAVTDMPIAEARRRFGAIADAHGRRTRGHGHQGRVRRVRAR